ncbi:hypothetical protein TorRG33x02_158880 [Trema orientale]|uniref:Uncharacterized protein n=1 Tax=Trema orientale TaxID=63057 RepID=A0A2P5ERY9_TREOI|nr:hypothetical protein TorRG33x02_158880 [Trema orientale]
MRKPNVSVRTSSIAAHAAYDALCSSNVKKREPLDLVDWFLVMSTGHVAHKCPHYRVILYFHSSDSEPELARVLAISMVTFFELFS